MTCDRVLAVLASLAVAGCAVSGAEPEVGDTSRAIVGGQSAPFDDSVVNLDIGCTGTLIRQNVVLTAAHCLTPGRIRFGPSIGSFTAAVNVAEAFQSRRYGAGLYAGGDIALVRMTSDAPAEFEPLPINDVLDLTQEEHNGATVRTVGYGNTDGINNEGYGVRRQVTHNLLGVEPEFIITGTDTANTCQGDSGGPTFMQIDGVERVIAVTSFGAAGCLGESRQTRVDAFMDEFISEVLDAWSGPCRRDGTCVESCPGFPDPDCGPCGLDGTCSTGCDKKDLDCPLGVALGGLCSDREDCESLACVAADDDDRVEYCSTACDPADAANNFGCPTPFSACESDGDGGHHCGFSGPSPTAQGASCFENSDCRSGLCEREDNICVERCDGDDACPEGYECGGIGEGVNACIPPRGGCSASSGSAGWLGLMAVFGLVWRRRRRRATRPLHIRRHS